MIGGLDSQLKQERLRPRFVQNVDGYTSKLKIETNCTEAFNVEGVKHQDLSLHSDWFIGRVSVPTYTLDELMATKLRALYQRRKGRDLFDLWYVLSKNLAKVGNVIAIFHSYNAHNGIKITQKLFAQNLEEKKHNQDFQQDIRLLLPVGSEWSFDVALGYIMQEIIPLV